MHSLMLQVEREKIDEADYITGDDFYDADYKNHFAVIADYTVELSDKARKETLKRFNEYPGLRVEDDKVTVVSKLEFFEWAYLKFTKKLGELAKNMSREVFASSKFYFEFYELKSAYSDEYGIWVYSNDYGTMPIDEFIRELKDGDSFYVGQILDYHY